MDPLGDVLFADGLLIGFLKDRRGLIAAGGGSRLQYRRRVVVLGPNSFEVEYGEPTGFVHGDGEVRIDHGVHRGGEERDGKMVGTDFQAKLGQFRVDGDIARDNGDLIEPVRAAKLLESWGGGVTLGKRRMAALRRFGGGGGEVDSSTQVSRIPGVESRPVDGAAVLD